MEGYPLGQYDQVRGLASLKSLTVHKVTFVNGQNLQGLISGCSLLESLSLKCCLGLDNINIDTPFHRLKHLYLIPCSASVVISCLNLVSLEFRAPDGLCVCNDHELCPLKLPIPEEGGGWFYITTLVSSDLCRFSSLKSVTVHKTPFKGHDMANLFSACPNLESLSLDGCEVFEIPFHHNLKLLDIKSVDFWQDEPVSEEVKIFCGPNLISMQWNQDVLERTTIKLVDCDGHAFSSSSLSPLRKLSMTECISHRNNYAAFKYLQELTLGPVGLGDGDILSLLSHCSCLERLSLSGGDSQLRHFKQLVVNLRSDAENVLWMVSLLQIAPNLHTFELHLGNYRDHPMDKCFPNEIKQIKYYHNHLKEVKISGFFGWNYEMEMTIYLLKYAASLELMTIDPNPWIYEDDDTWSERVMIVSGLQSIRTWLRKHVNSRTKLVIL